MEPTISDREGHIGKLNWLGRVESCTFDRLAQRTACETGQVSDALVQCYNAVGVNANVNHQTRNLKLESTPSRQRICAFQVELLTLFDKPLAVAPFVYPISQVEDLHRFTEIPPSEEG